MSLSQALDISLKLKAALTAEVARSQEARSVLKTLDTPTLLAQASLREAFNHQSAWLSAELARELSSFALEHGQSDISLEQIKEKAPFEGAQLDGVFGEIRSLSHALSELDAVNQQLAENALTVVRAYVTHIAPQPNAYNRRGQAFETDAVTHSDHA